MCKLWKRRKKYYENFRFEGNELVFLYSGAIWRHICPKWLQHTKKSPIGTIGIGIGEGMGIAHWHRHRHRPMVPMPMVPMVPMVPMPMVSMPVPMPMARPIIFSRQKKKGDHGTGRGAGPTYQPASQAASQTDITWAWCMWSCYCMNIACYLNHRELLCVGPHA